MIKKYLSKLICLALTFATLSTSAQNNKQMNLPRVKFNCSFIDTANLIEKIPFIIISESDESTDIKINGLINNLDHKKFFEIEYLIQNPAFGNSLKIKSIPVEYLSDSLMQLDGINLIKLGLASILSKTKIQKDLTIHFKSEEKLEENVADKWNNWVFNIGASAYLDKDKSYSYQDIGIDFSANRLTPDWKINNSISVYYNKNEYHLEDYSATIEKRSYYANHLAVRSVGEHISIGETTTFTKSDYSNLDASISFAPAIEFNVFKYSESTKKQLTFRYAIGYRFQDYIDTTIYSKTSEHLWRQSLNMNLVFNQDWGTLSTTISAANYLHDFSFNALNISTSMNLRLSQRLSFNLSGGFSLIHDQLGLPKGDASSEDILLRLKELETNYRYWSVFGLNFTFGSIKNSIVNPRFNEF